MTTLEHYDWRNISYSKALEHARLWEEAFSEDPLMRVFRPAESRFGPDELPPIAEYESLIARAEQYKRIVETDAQRFHLRVRSDPRVRLFLLKDPQGQHVAGAHWILPKYLPQVRPPLLHRLKTWLLRCWYAVKQWWTWLGHANPNDDSTLRNELARGRRDLGLEDSPERRDELLSSDPKRLKEISYPRDLTYYLAMLVTRRSEQRKGFGATLFKESLHALRPFKRPPHFVGPPKAALLSSPAARGFYLRMGFLQGAVAEHELPNGEWFPHSYYFINLHDKV